MNKPCLGLVLCAGFMASGSLIAIEETFLFELIPKFRKLESTDPKKLEERKWNSRGYILGTQHNIGLDVFPSPVAQLLMSTKTLFVEQIQSELTYDQLNALNGYQPVEEGSWTRSFAYSEETFIREKIDSLYLKYKAISQELFIKKSALRPWAVYALLSLAHLFEIAMSGHSEGMDSALHRTAIEKGIPVIGLETYASNITSYGFQKFSAADAVKRTKELIKHWSDNTSPKDPEAGRQQYLRGNLEEMEKATLIDDPEELINRQVDYNRNIDEIKSFEGEVRKIKKNEYPFLIAVGVAHLLGKGGWLSHPDITENYTIRRIGKDGKAKNFVYAPEK